MKLNQLIKDVEVIENTADAELDINYAASDSRRISCGNMFICQRGTKKNGNDYIANAIENGASVIVTDEADGNLFDIPHIKVKDARLAEAVIWNNFYGDPAAGMKVIAVTGTNGKTSTVFMLRQIFMEAGFHTGVITTVKAMADDKMIGIGGGSAVSDADAAMTTPDPEYLYKAIYEMKRAGVEVLIFEASSHSLYQKKIDPIHIDIALFTNLTEEHLDFHGTMENYFSAKARLADMADCIVINCDDEYMSRLSHRVSASQKVISCSADYADKPASDYCVSALRQKLSGVDGVEYIYFSKDAVFYVTSPIPGCFTVYNTLLAISAAIEAGIDPVVVRRAIRNLKGIDGRLEKVDLNNPTADYSVFIDYAHTPAALETVLKTVREIRHPGQRITLLFGCGGDRDRSKRKKMGMIASRLADFVIITSDNCRSEDPDSIIQEIMSGIDAEKPHAVIRDRKRAIEYGICEARKDEILILAGKGHEKYEINAEGKHPFDETEIVRKAALKRASDRL